MNRLGKAGIVVGMAGLGMAGTELLVQRANASQAVGVADAWRHSIVELDEYREVGLGQPGCVTAGLGRLAQMAWEQNRGDYRSAAAASEERTRTEIDQSCNNSGKYHEDVPRRASTQFLVGIGPSFQALAEAQDRPQFSRAEGFRADALGGVAGGLVALGGLLASYTRRNP
jgi:hypothetical protein